MSPAATKTRPPAKKAAPRKKTEPKPPPSVVLTVAPQRLAAAIKAVGLAASTDEGRPILCGIHIVAAEGLLRIEATDSYRLHIAEVKLVESELDPKASFDAIVPAKWLTRWIAETAKGRPRRPWRSSLTFTETHLRIVDASGEERGTRLIERGGIDYPSTERLMERVPEADAGASAFNPQYLGHVFKAGHLFGAGYQALRVGALDPTKPCRFEVRSGEDRLRMLLMSVRVP